MKTIGWCAYPILGGGPVPLPQNSPTWNDLSSSAGTELEKAISNYLDGIDRDGAVLTSALRARKESDRHMSSVRKVFTSLLFTDIADSSGIYERYGDEFGHWIVKIHDRIVGDSVAEEDGIIVKHTGDGLLAEFGSHENSVRAAANIIKMIEHHNANFPLMPLHLRISVNVGSVIDEGHDLYGTEVNLAARLCAKAKPDKVLVTNIVCQRCLENGPVFDFVDLEPFVPRGFSSPIPICELVVH